MRSWARALKHLQLVDWEPLLPRRPLCQIVPESLEDLLITSSHDWNFEKDSMHFPSLRRLTLSMGDSIPFLEAIVAPKLASFSFDPGYKESISETFTGTKMKFNNVSHLVLPHISEVNEQKFRLFKLLYIYVAYLPMLFPSRGPGAIDHCTCIESLDIQGIILGSFQPLQDLVYGFEKRMRFGQRKLHLKLTGNRFMDKVVTLNTSDTLFQRLQECSASVVLDGIPAGPLLSVSRSLCILGRVRQLTRP
ncbi:hypothetical protein BKA83DRAFT_4297888 [Pisolithus microcarpus]|nr:hypothetical protein BKA83DRAFT_4297888 [Pisolithus microcarpus]